MCVCVLCVSGTECLSGVSAAVPEGCVCGQGCNRRKSQEKVLNGLCVLNIRLTDWVLWECLVPSGPDPVLCVMKRSLD